MGLFFYSSSGSLLIALGSSMAVCALLGVCIERFVYFPLLKFPPFVPLIGSISILLIIEEVCRLIFGPHIHAFPASLPFPEVSLGSLSISSMLIGVYLITLVILFFLWFLVKKTSFGLAMRAPSQDIEIAEANGINARRTIDLTFVIGSAVAAVAGVLVGIYYNQVYPTMGAVPAYKSLALIVVGGLGSIQGAVFASLLLGIAETLLIGYANIPLPRDAIAFIAMISVLMWKPTGLFSSRKGA